MSETHSQAKVKSWAKVPKKERSRRMSELRRKHLDSLSATQRKNIGKKLTLLRLSKNK